MKISQVCGEYVFMFFLTQHEGDFSLLSSFNYITLSSLRVAVYTFPKT